MNFGRIDKDTAAGELFDMLKEYRGEWFSSWQIANNISSCCPATRISEVRAQLPPTWRLERKQEGRKHFYRLVRQRARV